MKTQILVFAVMLLTSMSFGQTKQQANQVAELDREISKLNLEKIKLSHQLASDYTEQVKKLEQEIISLNNARLALADSSSGSAEETMKEIGRLDQEINHKQKLQEFYLAKSSQAGDNTWINAEIAKKDKKIAELQSHRDKIFLDYTTTEEIPREVTACTFNKRKRGNNLRRDEIGLKVIENNVNSANISGAAIKPGQVNEVGFLVIVFNNYHNEVKTVFEPLDGGLGKEVTMSGKSRSDVFLLPGKYLAHSYSNLGYIGSKYLDINGNIVEVFNEKCYGSVLIASHP